MISKQNMKQTTLNFGAVTKSSKPAQKIAPIEITPEEESNFNPDYSKIFDSPEDFKNCLEPSWRKALNAEFSKPYFKKLLDTLKKETKEIFPPKCDILNAFKFCPFNKVKVVIVGQDPYHNVGQAHGLSFSVKKGVQVPPSLQNMYKELQSEYPDFKIPNHGFLESWAKQGVLMLNASLTVAAHEANSHEKYGWHYFTNAAIDAINKRLEGVVFLAWGNSAKKVCSMINKNVHSVLQSGHPSPLSVRFFMGCGHFKEANRILIEKGKTPIRWESVND
ncbi:Uracil-DNA glycosylase [Tritrichomonas foetus]|uniref:Uracil-DNA glycosylase n=1 Tax=Tritrichomonas foetus TaxID=1144522 RepID=A0A1J4JJ14_9EUKA|nr:Uracil-DNA glycosylase [Tritrichomonas foetus]|eukprot:OHS99142.1 Uracil-DNA glycosylase [Tritrichomonas foetus]